MRRFFRVIENCEHAARIAQYGRAAGLACGNVLYEHGSVRLLVEASSHYLSGKPPMVCYRDKRAIRAIEVADPDNLLGPHEIASTAWDAIESLGLADKLECDRQWLLEVACSEALEDMGCHRHRWQWWFGERCFGANPVAAWEMAEVA